MTKCWLCSEELVGPHRTKEHIIPNAIGGRRKASDFICTKCNNDKGRAWESEVAKQFLGFSSASGVKRENGSHPAFPFTSASGEKLILRADTTVGLQGHQLDVSEEESKLTLTIRSNEHKTNDNLVKKYARDYRDEFDFDSASMRCETESSFMDEPMCLEFFFGGPLVLRSMVKTNLALLSECGVDPKECALALSFLSDPSESIKGPYNFFYNADLVKNRPKDHLFHCVSVIGLPQHRSILGYVEFFNWARLLILISNNYSGEAFQQTYALDPVNVQELALTIDFGVVDLNILDFGFRPEEPPKLFIESCNAAAGIIENLQKNRVREHAIAMAKATAFKQLNLDPQQEVPADKLQKWSNLYELALAAYHEHQVKMTRARGQVGQPIG